MIQSRDHICEPHNISIPHKRVKCYQLCFTEQEAKTQKD
jgi:hypothetical protein